ncbi:MAG TPA: NUDIX hydrolase [Jatrophihabitans sp.]|jgi:8-oxo-dGTP diphosphatase|uniref:NUDIX domain-containing protein n=1 Tax=Jatrophihabitans sp. TaxID=1932789 RepID=UPI002EF75A5D
MSTKTPSTRQGEDAFLASYDPSQYPTFALTVDLTIFTIRNGALCVLLIERGDHPYKGFWALPGGHVVHSVENAETAAIRELGEETGLDWGSLGAGHLEQVRTYSDPDRDPRVKSGLHVASIAYFALAPDLPDPRAGTDASAARYWPVADLDLATQARHWQDRSAYPGDAPALAYDHARILSDSLERVRAKLEYTTLATRFVSEPFSLNDLRRVYVAVWGAAPDLGNFRRKVLSTEGFVRPAAQKAGSSASDRGGPRPMLYLRGEAALLHPAMLRTPTSVHEC